MDLSGIARIARWPPAVLPGARVGVAALSGPVDAGRLATGLDALRALGFSPVMAPNLDRRCGLFAGSDEERLAGLYALTDDPTIEAVVFARGGHGVLRLLPRLDWDRLGRHPRAYVGYSDLTPFLAHVVDRLGLVAFHGPMVAADLARGLGRVEREVFLQALAGLGPLRLPVTGTTTDTPITGRLTGGCLSLLTATLGTPYASRFDDALVVIEDVNEPPYRLDRMLTHLALSDTLIGARGLMFGHRAGQCGGAGSDDDWRSILEGLDGLVDTPSCWGLSAGHEAPNLTVPLGAVARFDPRRLELEIATPPHADRVSGI